VAGLALADHVGRQTLEIRASKVCNCTGAGTRALAARYAAERRDLFVPSVAFNLLLDCEPLSESALAVAAPAAGSPVLFLCPAAGGLWAGTGHAGRPDGCVDPQVAESEVQGYLDQVNRAIPGINLGLRHVRKVYSGLLPVKTSGDTDLTAREVIVDHARQGGADGLYSVAGIKFTTARKVGERAVRKMFRVGADSRRKQAAPPPAMTAATPLLLDGNKAMSVGFEQAARIVREVAAAESVVTPEDFLLRRTAWMFSMTDMAPLERLVRAAMAERAVS
jgi:glycerol-3-phosphate dehydrogenase